jgi:DNA repair exonuclease SbcCD ATPase subunit
MKLLRAGLILVAALIFTGGGLSAQDIEPTEDKHTPNHENCPGCGKGLDGAPDDAPMDPRKRFFEELGKPSNPNGEPGEGEELDVVETMEKITKKMFDAEELLWELATRDADEQADEKMEDLLNLIQKNLDQDDKSEDSPSASGSQEDALKQLDELMKDVEKSQQESLAMINKLIEKAKEGG